ncbi:hypothetical protein F5B19DRAFT_12678 [Rostrohypoxylon terebratum]|nr:hypothetical protein F5B19DRAFT_12678 [Rostrohypoxylon terebratum]
MSKLRRDQVVLSSHLDILDRHATELAVGSIQAYLRNHKRCIEKLLKDSEGVSQVLIQILNHRNDEILIRTQANTQQMSEENSIGTRSVVMILENSQRDTKMVKVLTIVAMLYLPASLVASIFSSNLVQFGSQPNPQSHNEGVYVAKEFWLLPAVSLGLLVVTFGLTHGLLRAYPSAW